MWAKEFLLGRSEGVRVDRQLSEKVRVTSGVPQGSAMGPLLFLAYVYVNDILRNNESNKRLFADDCLIYRKIIFSSDIDKVQTNLDRLREWVGKNKNGDKSRQK